MAGEQPVVIGGSYSQGWEPLFVMRFDRQRQSRWGEDESVHLAAYNSCKTEHPTARFRIPRDSSGARQKNAKPTRSLRASARGSDYRRVSRDSIGASRELRVGRP